MRLCVISGTFHPEPGGPPTYLYHLLPALVERGHAVSVITYGEPTPPSETLYPYPVTRLTRRTPIPLRLWAFTREVVKQGRSAHVLFASDYGLPAALASMWLRKPLVLKIVADFAWEFASRHSWTDLPVADFQAARHSLRVRLLRSVQRWYARRADTILVPSQHVGRLVRGWGVPDGKVRVIYNALPSQLSNIPERGEARRQLGWPEDAFTLVTVGRLAEVKRVDLQVEAVARLDGVRLVIVGDGPEREPLERLASQPDVSERVTFTGALPHDQALLAIRAADVLVLSSHTEGLSHVLIEAMQLGTPCVATNVGGNPEVITDGVDGLLVPPRDADALAATIRDLRDHPARRRALAEAALKSVERFSWEALVDQTEAVLRETARG